MSVVVPVGGIPLTALAHAGALALAVTVDLALGDVPGRTAAVRGLGRLIAVVDLRVDRLVRRLGGGRGGDLFGGVLRTALVIGPTVGLVGIVVDRADAVGGAVTLIVRTAVIAAGLAIRSTGDALLEAVAAPDPVTAGRWLSTAAGRPIAGLNAATVAGATVGLTGVLLVGVVVAPLLWLTVAGPAGLWGITALRLLSEAEVDRRASTPTTRVEVPVRLARLAEVPAAVVGVGLIATAATVLRLDGQGAVQAARRSTRQRLGPAAWAQAALAGALGVVVRVTSLGRWAVRGDEVLVGEPRRTPDATLAALGVRVLQLVALLAAGLALLGHLLGG